jgi:TPR repeat protein
MARYEAHSREIVETAAEAGMPDALFELGLMYCSGRGVSLDLIEAHKWFNLAATRGNSDARRYRSEIARELSRPELGDAQRRARAWLGRA